MMCQPRQRSGSTPLPITPAVPTPAGFNEATPCSPVSPVVQTPAGGGTVQPLHAPGVSLVSGFADVGGAFADARLLFDLWHLRPSRARHATKRLRHPNAVSRPMAILQQRIPNAGARAM